MGSCAQFCHCADGGPIRARFVDIARGCQVTEKLTQAVGKRISDELYRPPPVQVARCNARCKIESSVDSYDDFQLPSVRTRVHARAHVYVRACMFRYVRRRACACVLSVQACACACVYACGALFLGVAACRRPFGDPGGEGGFGDEGGRCLLTKSPGGRKKIDRNPASPRPRRALLISRRLAKF